MTDLDRFTLEGQTYYQQGRKCGRAGCKCQQGELHGPYWYTRNTDTGRVQYIGKDLPPAITTARTAHDRLLSAMVKERRRLAGMFDALSRLIRNDPLSEADRRAIESLGLGAALVSEPGRRVTQDEDAGALVSGSTWSNAQDQNPACVEGARDPENVTQDEGMALVSPGSSPVTQDERGAR